MFVKEYLIDLNATQSAIRAGYSKKTAEVQGPRLLGNVKVAAEIQRAKEKREEKAEKSGADVIRELTKLAFAGLCDRLPAASKVRALELLGKHYGIISDKVDLNIPFTLVLGKKGANGS